MSYPLKLLLGLGKDFICECHNLWPSESDSTQLHSRTLTRRMAQWSEDVVPTVAFNFRKIRKGNVTLKLWDVAGESIISLALTSRHFIYHRRPTQVPFNVGEIL